MMDNSSDVKFNLTQSDPDVSSAVSDDVYIVILIVTNVLIANILSLLGIVGSILNIIILSHHKMQDPTNVVFLAISVCDFIFSVTQISFNFSIASFLINFFVLDWAVTIHVISFDRINYLAVLISIHLVTLVSIERMMLLSLLLVKIPKKISDIIYWIDNILIQINSSFNFIIYVTGSPKFKKTFLKLFHFKNKQI
ncbi:hypothetical protein BgiMline_002461 [Biomphalaria glabrata]